MLCHVSKPDCVVFEVDVDDKAKGQEVLDWVCKQLSILEVDYFGLQYTGPREEQLWLNLRNRVSKQVQGAPPYRLRLRVKFFVEPHRLLQESTRHQFYLHLRQDLMAHDRYLPLVGIEVLIQMAALIVQAATGDCSAAAHKEYLQVVPNATEDIIDRIVACHLDLAGLGSSRSEYKLLQLAWDCEVFSLEFHQVTLEGGVIRQLGVKADGLNMYDKNFDFIQRIPYTSIVSATQTKCNLYLVWKGDSAQNHSLHFKLPTRRAAIALYRSVTEHHTFYRCDRVHYSVMSQYSRDLKGTLASIFNEDTPLGKEYNFDVRRTCIEVYDQVRRDLYRLSVKDAEMASPESTPKHNACANDSTSDESTQQLKELQDALSCRVCMDEAISCAFCPCGHAVCCDACAARCPQCPICRADTERTQHIFLPLPAVRHRICGETCSQLDTN
ncbi:PREDICTED: E3 ubiquitin-protein ligase MYLIP-like [Priapulus caudatus]|uniref:E3 ubiquitin-protein ligase MYLIP-like n=1 Tax=Priapulus caudatus TaxID=37621 RepID=A0ABM1E277_PRICU|nr:PREDICTED: E3 ubiquitin-protein ligase MYLIP-like [Priapulus caudatus]